MKKNNSQWKKIPTGLGTDARKDFLNIVRYEAKRTHPSCGVQYNKKRNSYRIVKE